MKLIELVELATGWNGEDATIYVTKPWAPDAEATMVFPAPYETTPIERDGRTYQYFLEGFIAREVLEDYAAAGQGADASTRQLCERLIRYAENDA
jgi:hypothetical protein